MLIKKTFHLKNIRAYSQLIASIIKSSIFGLGIFLLSTFLSKNAFLRINNVFLGLATFGLIIAYASPLIVESSSSGLSYIKTIMIWILPIIYYTFGSKDLNNEMYEKLLIVMLIYTVIEFVLINFTGVSLFESDRLRAARNFGYIRSEGVSHNSSISSALAVSIFLRVFLSKGFSIPFFLIATLTILFLGSGAGMLLFVFAILFFIVNRVLLISLSFVFFIFVSVFFTQFPAMEILGNIHPKISYEYISFIFDLKLVQIYEMVNTDFKSIFFGLSLSNNELITSGDFGYGTMVLGIGLIPTLIALFAIFTIFVRASRLGNFAPFSILIIETIHYPVFVDPISAYIMAQYAISNQSEK